MEVLWSTALGVAVEEASTKLEGRRIAVEEKEKELRSAEQAITDAQARLHARDEALRATLAMAETQLQQANEHASQLRQAATIQASEVKQLRESLAATVLERDVERRRHDERVQSLQMEREQMQHRADSNERRMLGEVDRARQEAKLARQDAAESARRREAAEGSLAEVSATLSQERTKSEIAIATLEAQLRASVQRASEYQAMIKLASSTKQAKRAPRKASVPNRPPAARKSRD
jgi:hypothetical protein